jgi:hypothetical protein
MATDAEPQPGDPILLFDGNSTQVEVASGPDYSLPPGNALTISAWIRPDTVEFPRQEGTNYVHWMESRRDSLDCCRVGLDGGSGHPQTRGRVSFVMINVLREARFNDVPDSLFEVPLDKDVLIHDDRTPANK